MNQDIESGAVKSTSTPEMMILVFLSAVAAIVQGLALFGWLSIKEGPERGPQVGFMSLDPPLTSIVFFAALFVIPTSVATPLSMFTHWKPNAALFKSQQVTDTLRGQFAAPFRMKYLYFVQALMNGIALISLKYKFWWPAALNVLNIVLYLAGLALVIKHFQNPNVPTDLATTAKSMIGAVGSTVASGRIESLEADVKMLKQELHELKSSLALRQTGSANEEVSM